MKPSLGRIVIYVTPGGEERAAIVSGVGEDGRVDLHAFTPGIAALQPYSNVPQHEEGTCAGRLHTWNWPPRV
jgi:hypothetical protein